MSDEKSAIKEDNISGQDNAKKKQPFWSCFLILTILLV